MESPINFTIKKESPPQDAFVSRIQEIVAHASSYGDAKIESFKSSAREMLLRFSAGIYSLLIGVFLTLIAVSFLMYGLSAGISQAIGVNNWLGFVITGAGLLLGNFIISRILYAYGNKKAVKKQVSQYESEMKWLYKKFGPDVNLPTDTKIPYCKNENEFMKWKASISRAAMSTSATDFKNYLSEFVDIKQWTREYPFYSTGIAAATGFFVAEQMTPRTFAEIDGLKELVEKPELQKKQNDYNHNSIKLAFVAMLASVAEDVLKSSFVPFIKEYVNGSKPAELHERRGQLPLD
jgi:hypothetical protein